MNQASCANEISLFFTIIIAISLFIDCYGHKHSKNITIVNSIGWSIFWIALAFVFYGFLWHEFSKEWANLFLVGYILEKSLSFDNLMIFMAIFSSFGITGLLQHKILFWGIFGAILFRGIFVFAGTSLFHFSSWVELIFAIFIIWSAIKMLTNKKIVLPNKNTNFANHWSIKLIGKLLPIYPKFYADKFFVTKRELVANNLSALATKHGKIYLTPAFLCLIIIETSDIAFAFDSVPAIIAITEQPILVYSSIIFAILGLRSLYFILAILAKYLIYLEQTVITLLFFIALKMLLQFCNHTIYNTGLYISPNTSLFVVLIMLTIGIIASILARKSTKN